MTYAKLAAGVTAGLLAIVMLALVTGCATSKSPLADATPLEKEFAAAAITWDLNRDGDVTCEEWKQYATQLFHEADRNRDGFLGKDEYAAMARTDRLFETAGFAYFDADGDGRIALAEIIDKPNPAFIYLDRDKNCVIGRRNAPVSAAAGAMGPIRPRASAAAGNEPQATSGRDNRFIGPMAQILTIYGAMRAAGIDLRAVARLRGNGSGRGCLTG